MTGRLCCLWTGRLYSTSSRPRCESAFPPRCIDPWCSHQNSACYDDDDHKDGGDGDVGDEDGYHTDSDDGGEIFLNQLGFKLVIFCGKKDFLSNSYISLK